MAANNKASLLRVGDMLYGYCGGVFGRDSYDEKRVEAVGADWVVVRDSCGKPDLYSGCPEDLIPYREKPADWDE